MKMFQCYICCFATDYKWNLMCHLTKHHKLQQQNALENIQQNVGTFPHINAHQIQLNQSLDQKVDGLPSQLKTSIHDLIKLI